MKDSHTTLDAVAQPVGSPLGKATSEITTNFHPDLSKSLGVDPNDARSVVPRYKVKTGGLFRCCLQSLREEMCRRQLVGEPLVVEGQRLPCVYHADSTAPVMVCQSGVWQWVG